MSGVLLAPSAVVFDLDGTLIDSRGDIAASVNHALLGSGRKALNAATIAGFVGDGARSLMARAAQLPESHEDIEPLLERFLRYYAEHPADFSRWVDGAPGVLDRVADLGLPLLLCTNKDRRVTESVLSALGVRTRFRAIYAAGDGPEKKPAAGPLIALAKTIGVPVESLIMVGDGPQDVGAARRAGCRVIGIASGYTPRERIAAAKPDLLLDGVGEVADVVRRWCDATMRGPAAKPSG